MTKILEYHYMVNIRTTTNLFKHIYMVWPVVEGFVGMCVCMNVCMCVCVRMYVSV